MILCAAQIQPFTGDVEQNLALHLQMIKRAAARQAGLVLFPELSLTGYEPSLAAELATTPADPRFAALQQAGDEYHMTVCAGMPLKKEGKPQIGMLIFSPFAAPRSYAKYFIHDDEIPFFSPGPENSMLLPGNLAPAICYELSFPAHVKQAAASGARTYLVSVAKTAEGMDAAASTLSGYAKDYALDILLANATGPCDNFTAAGRSAVWNKKGEMIACMDETSTGILLYNPEKREANIITV